MRRILWLAVAFALSVALASLASAQGNGNGGGGGGGNGNGGGGGGGNPDPGNGGGNGGNPGNGGGGNPGNGGGNPDPGPPAPQPDPPAPQPEPPAPDPGNGNGGGNGGNNGGGSDGGGGGNLDPGPPDANVNAQGGNANAGGANAGGENNANAHGANGNAGGAVAGGNSAEAAEARANETRGKSNASHGRNENDTRGKSGEAPGRDRNETGKPDGTPRGREDAGAPGGAGNAVGPDTLPAVALERASVPQENTRAAIVKVRAQNRTLDVAQGSVEVTSEGVENETNALVILIHPNGTEEVLAEGKASADWNTTAYENGYYTVEVRERASSGQMMTVASTRVLVENPRAAMVAAVAAVATGAAVSVGAGMLAARSFDVLALLKSAGAAAGEAGGDMAGEAVEDKLRTRTAAVAAVDWRFRSALLLLLAGVMLAFFKVFAARESLLLALPIAFLAAFVYTLGDYGAEWALARASGARTRFRIWTPGAISLALSSVLFRSPFGYPGYVSETDVGKRGQGAALRSRAGLRALAFMGVGLALTLPFLLTGALWRWEVAEFGVGIALMMAAAGAMPFSPMPGKDVWAWSKPAWAGVFVAFVALYVAWQIAMLPMWLLIGLALVAAAGFVAALRWLSRTARDA